MVIRETLKQQLAEIPEGEVFTLSDFDVPRQYLGTLAKALSLLSASGEIKRVAKGRYYKPRLSRFGELRPGVEQLVKDYLVKDGEVIGYLTGVEAFSALGLTTQVSGDIMVGTNKYKRPIRRGAYKVTFLLQPNPITAEDIDMFRILDALRLIRTIPAATPEESVLQLGVILKALASEQQKRIIHLAKAYPPYVRALLGAILEHQGMDAQELSDTLNPMTTYKLSLSKEMLPTLPNWNII